MYNIGGEIKIKEKNQKNKHIASLKENKSRTGIEITSIHNEYKNRLQFNEKTGQIFITKRKNTELIFEDSLWIEHYNKISKKSSIIARIQERIIHDPQEKFHIISLKIKDISEIFHHIKPKEILTDSWTLNPLVDPKQDYLEGYERIQIDFSRNIDPYHFITIQKNPYFDSHFGQGTLEITVKNPITNNNQNLYLKNLTYKIKTKEDITSLKTQKDFIAKRIFEEIIKNLKETISAHNIIDLIHDQEQDNIEKDLQKIFERLQKIKDIQEIASLEENTRASS